MKEFKITPKIITAKDCAEFVNEFKISKDDLIFTIEVTWETYFADICAGTVIFVEKYGSGEPNDEMIEAIARDIKSPYKRVIAIGGGTVLDISKLFALKNLLPVTDLFDRKLEAVKDKELILVPTTCGTGSEVTNISILEFKQRHTKFGLACDALYADTAVIVPELLYKLPFKVFAASSIDALIHSVESYLSPKASAISRMFSVEAMTLILKGYKTLAEKGKSVLHDILPEFCLASTLAGIAFGNAGCGAVHAMSYPLGAQFHIPHGEANYAMFTGVFKKYMEINPNGDIYELNCIIANVLECSPNEVYNEIERLLDSVVLKKKSLEEYGMNTEQIQDFADSVIENQQRLLANNYVPLTRCDIINIYNGLYEKGDI